MASMDRDTLVSGVLERMDRHNQRMRLALLAAAFFEGLLMVIAILKLDWGNDTQVLLFLFSVLSYTILALGLVALGAHVSRVGARVVAALEGRPQA
jgi:Kef-type K+ transport system membrane component KefB